MFLLTCRLCANVQNRAHFRRNFRQRSKLRTSSTELARPLKSSVPQSPRAPNFKLWPRRGGLTCLEEFEGGEKLAGLERTAVEVKPVELGGVVRLLVELDERSRRTTAQELRLTLHTNTPISPAVLPVTTGLASKRCYR